MKKSTLDLGDPEIRRKLLAKILPTIYGETEIDYVLNLLKDQTDEQVQGIEELTKIYDKSIDTLEVLMNKMGLRDQFERVLDPYTIPQG